MSISLAKQDEDSANASSDKSIQLTLVAPSKCTQMSRVSHIHINVYEFFDDTEDQQSMKAGLGVDRAQVRKMRS